MDLASYDLILINTSAGKDSQTMMHLVVDEANRQGVLSRVQAVHATFKEEWEGTVELAQEHADSYGIPLHIVQHPRGSLLDRVRNRRQVLDAKGKTETAAWPSNTERFCTGEFKRDQVAKLITKLCEDLRNRGIAKPKVLNCMGLRAAESSARAKKETLKLNARQSSSRKEVYEWLPIFDLTLDNVWSIIKASGRRYHPAYDLGMPRLSCCFCIFASREALIVAGHANPQLLKEYVQVEIEVRSTFRKELPMISILEAVESGERPQTIRTWEM